MKFRSDVLSLILIFAAPVLWAPQMHHHAEPSEKLGTVSFPISCAPGLQPSFEHSIALLHSFSYDEAEKQFQQIAAKDPGCAMAYWGEALSLYRQLWFPPEEPVLKRGLALVQRAEAAKAKTQRERDYIAALAAFYGDYDKKDHPTRAAAFSQAMEKVYQHYPDDREAAAFYALSLLSSEPEDDPQLAQPKKAVAILNAVLEKEPNHPGVAHYLIHACDNSQMAELGLPAARHYAAIAPASAHALHMPSHIFARLGLWQEDIQSNLASVAAVENPAGPHVGAEHSLHAMDFLEYAYLQIGDDAKASAIVARASAVRKEQLDEGFGDFLGYVNAHIPALYALETRQWKAAEALEPPVGADPNNQAITYWARAVAAGHLRDVPAASKAFAQFDAMLDAVRKGPRPFLANGMATNRDEAGAWLAFAEGKNYEAITLLRPLADDQDQIGKGEVELPAREMLADILLEIDRPQDALAEYEKSLKTDPNRFNGLYGAARAAEQSDLPEKAASYYARLLKNCESASDSDRPELARARTLLAREMSPN
jgi:tetratricopeptide (TPR) repeat protein